MHDDDRPMGRRLSRRELVGLFGASLAAQDCIALPQQTEGPYFVEERLERSDIRVDPSTGVASRGIPLDLRLVISSVTDAGACQALARAQVEVWHCDAAGVYSDVRDRSLDTTGQKFLRGHQTTDAAGLARFATISRVVWRARRAHPLQGAHAGRGRPHRRVHVAALLRRRPHRPGTRAGAVLGAQRPAAAQFARHDLPRGRAEAGAAGG